MANPTWNTSFVTAGAPMSNARRTVMIHQASQAIHALHEDGVTIEEAVRKVVGDARATVVGFRYNAHAYWTCTLDSTNGLFRVEGTCESWRDFEYRVSTCKLGDYLDVLDDWTLGGILENGSIKMIAVDLP